MPTRRCAPMCSTTRGRLRRHVAIYVNGEPVRDRTGLGDPVASDDEIYVFQALTGG